MHLNLHILLANLSTLLVPLNINPLGQNSCPDGLCAALHLRYWKIQRNGLTTGSEQMYHDRGEIYRVQFPCVGPQAFSHVLPGSSTCPYHSTSILEVSTRLSAYKSVGCIPHPHVLSLSLQVRFPTLICHPRPANDTFSSALRSFVCC